MAEDFQARIGASNWRNLSNSAFSGGSPPCFTGYSDIGGYGWSATQMFCEEPSSVSGISFDFPRAQKAQILDPVSGGGSILIDSDSSTMDFSVSSSPTSDWNQIPLSRRNGTSGFTSPSDLSTIVEDENSLACNIFKPVDQDFYAAEGCLSSDIRSGEDPNFSSGFPVGSASYGQGSVLLQNLINSQTQQSSFLPNNSSSNSLSSADFGLNCDELSSAWPKVGSSYQKTSTSQHQNVGLCFSKNAPFWNSSSKKLQLHAGEDVQQPGLIEKRLNVGGDLAFKRPRIETPSPLPTFKVRKEKLGDRITALQQLVSPFGKTDTASVLHEAIEYIKFLHEQVSVLSTPYMKSGASYHHQKEPEEATQELRNRGLCLVPIPSTLAAAASETMPEFWTPTFGATLK